MNPFARQATTIGRQTTTVFFEGDPIQISIRFGITYRRIEVYDLINEFELRVFFKIHSNYPFNVYDKRLYDENEEQLKDCTTLRDLGIKDGDSLWLK